ncbi:S26 family signal peptidase [Klebsiella pneumoniae subsp. pneumoniae]|nr:S26 family signal peptidase [Klebsiella pneumoniae subsp. pneumoniae]
MTHRIPMVPIAQDQVGMYSPSVRSAAGHLDWCRPVSTSVMGDNRDNSADSRYAGLCAGSQPGRKSNRYLDEF